MGALEAAVQELQEQMQHMAAALTLLQRSSSQDDEDATVHDTRHQEWKCSCCRTRLGFYDTQEDVLRIRVKDYHVHVRLGEGGEVKVPCRRCGHDNVVSWVAPKAGEGDDPGPG